MNELTPENPSSAVASTAGLGVFANLLAPNALLIEDLAGFSMVTTTEEPTSLVVQMRHHQRQEKERLGQFQPEAQQRHLTLQTTGNLLPGQVDALTGNARQQHDPLAQREALTEVVSEPLEEA